MKLVKTVIELEVYGQTVSLKKPTYREAQEYRDALKKLSDNEDAGSVMIEFLSKMGLPKEVFEQLELGHVNEIMEALTDTKKK